MLTKENETSLFDKAIAALADTDARLQDLEAIYNENYKQAPRDSYCDESYYKRFNIGFDDDSHLTTARYQNRTYTNYYYANGNQMPLHFSVPISGRNKLIQEWLGTNDVAIYRNISLETNKQIFKNIFLNIKKMIMKEINTEQKDFIKSGNTYEAFLNNLISVSALPDSELVRVSSSDISTDNAEEFVTRLKNIKSFDDIDVDTIVDGILEVSLREDAVAEDDLIWLVENYPSCFVKACHENQWNSQTPTTNWKYKKNLLSKLIPVLYQNTVSNNRCERGKFDTIFSDYISNLNVTININDISTSDIPYSDDLNKEIDTINVTVICDKFENRILEVYSILKHSKKNVEILYTDEFIKDVHQYLDNLQRAKGLIVNDEIEDDSVADTINLAIANCSKVIDCFENKSIPEVYPHKLTDKPQYGMTFTI